MNYAQAEKILKSCGQEHVLAYWKKLSKKEREELIKDLTVQMKEAAKLLEFEHAAFLRDKINELKEQE